MPYSWSTWKYKWKWPFFFYFYRCFQAPAVQPPYRSYEGHRNVTGEDEVHLPSPDLILAVGSRAREVTVRIRSWFLNHARLINPAIQFLKCYRAPSFSTALDHFWSDFCFFCLTAHGLGFWARIATRTPLFYYVWIKCTPPCFWF
jgi:hypothetical protein